MNTSIDKLLLAFKGHLLGAGPLAPDQWEAIVGCCMPVYTLRNEPLLGFPGDMFFVAEGLLKEVHEGTLVNRFKHTIHCFLRETDVFFIPLSGQRNVFVAMEDAVMLRMNRVDVVRLRQRHPPLVELFERLYALWYEHISVRYELLQLPKKMRYQNFRTLFPGLAARMLDKEVMQYLDISEGYFPKVK